jgi:hypothetical protein
MVQSVMPPGAGIGTDTPVFPRTRAGIDFDITEPAGSDAGDLAAGPADRAMAAPPMPVVFRKVLLLIFSLSVSIAHRLLPFENILRL